MAGLVWESPKSQNANKQSRLVTYNYLHLFIYIYIYIMYCILLYIKSNNTWIEYSYTSIKQSIFCSIYIYICNYVQLSMCLDCIVY